MWKLFLFASCMLKGAQITDVLYEQFAHVAQISCVVSTDAVLQYNPGFKVPMNVESYFKKKYFFCPHGTIASSVLKKTMQRGTQWVVMIKNILIPCPGVVIICAYDPVNILFSWIKDAVNHKYVFYFDKKSDEMIPMHIDQSYYAFNKALPEIMLMCYS